MTRPTPRRRRSGCRARAAAAAAAAPAPPPPAGDRDAKTAGEVHVQFGRHRLDAHLRRARADDDHPGPRPVLWRHGAQEERGRHRDDELRHHLSGHDRLRDHHLQSRLHDRLAIPRRDQSRLPARHPERHLERHRQSERPRGDDPRDRLHLLPDDLRDHHAGADRRRLRRTHEVLRHAVVHRPVGDPGLRADRALGMGTGRLHVQRATRTPRSRSSTSPAAPSCISTLASPA